MSRSYKKPFITDQQASRKPDKSRASASVNAKRSANQAVRRANKKACKEDPKAELADGKAYRKESCSWNIRDYSFHCPKDPKAKRK